MKKEPRIKSRKEYNEAQDQVRDANERGFSNYSLKQLEADEITPFYPYNVILPFSSTDPLYTRAVRERNMNDIDTWGNEELRGYNILFVDFGYFELEEDAALFKLTWG